MLAAGVEKTYRDLIIDHSLHGMDVHYIHARRRGVEAGHGRLYRLA
jgi:hypothetical protein